jgi:hypothetical protein
MLFVGYHAKSCHMVVVIDRKKARAFAAGLDEIS